MLLDTPISFTASQLLLNISNIGATTNSGTLSGRYIYTPPPGFSETGSFTYDISDDQSGAANATTITSKESPNKSLSFKESLVEELNQRFSSKYFPQAITILTGQFDSGALSDFTVANDNAFQVKSIYVAANAGGETDWYGKIVLTCLPSAVMQLTVIYKGHYSKTSVTQQFYLYNFTTDSWDLFDTRSVGNTNDVTVTTTISSNPRRYVSPNGVIRARVKGFRTGTQTIAKWVFTCCANFLSWDVEQIFY